MLRRFIVLFQTIHHLVVNPNRNEMCHAFKYNMRTTYHCQTLSSSRLLDCKIAHRMDHQIQIAEKINNHNVNSIIMLNLSTLQYIRMSPKHKIQHPLIIYYRFLIISMEHVRNMSFFKFHQYQLTNQISGSTRNLARKFRRINQMIVFSENIHQKKIYKH